MSKEFNHGFNKKQKITNYLKEDDAGHSKSHHHKTADLNLKNENLVVSIDMCFFCFDVLISHLNQYEDPIPKFSNKH